MIKLPELFVERTKLLLGAEYSFFERALGEPAPVSVRINSKFLNYQPSHVRVPWCEEGYYLQERPLFTADPLLHAGVYYVQEASSMFLKEVANQFLQDADRVLDLCAAPGGKSTLLLQSLSEDALLVSNEFVRSRAMILAENISKWGNPNVIVTNNAPADFNKLPAFFDAIVVDAPCSGEGMFRKDPGAIAAWSVQNVNQCAMRQKTILQDVWQSLKQGGLLIYSTCTYNREENEDNVDWACKELGAELLKMDVGQFEGIVESDCGCRFYPHKIKGEGFFIAILRKTVTDNYKNSNKSKKDKPVVRFPDKHADFKSAIIDPNKYVISAYNQQVIAFPRGHISCFTELNDKLNCLLSGILLGEYKGKDFVPAHQFALSKIINRDAFACADLDYQTAVAYLRKECINLPDDTPRGYVLVCYKGQTLGWVKNLVGRANNLYPQHWRIRMHL